MENQNAIGNKGNNIPINGKIRLSLSYFTPSRGLSYDFYSIPKVLIHHPLFRSIDPASKLLYSMMLNRVYLSAQNHKDFTDEHGRLYIIYTNEQIQMDLCVSDKPATKMLKDLESIGLIERKRQGQGKPTLIYVKDFASCDFTEPETAESLRIVHSPSLESENVRFKTRTYSDSRLGEFPSLESEILRCSNTYISETNVSENNPINQSSAKPPHPIQADAPDEKRLMDKIDIESEWKIYEELVKENIGYDHLKENNKNFKYDETLDEYVSLIVETICSKKPTIRINGEERPHSIVKGQLLKLDSEHIEYVQNCMNDNPSDIRNIKQYLLTSLYNAPNTISNHYGAMYRHDFYGGGNNST